MNAVAALLNAISREHTMLAVAICTILIVIAALWAAWLRRGTEETEAGDTQGMLGTMRTADAARMARETDALLNGRRPYAWPWIVKAAPAKPRGSSYTPLADEFTPATAEEQAPPRPRLRANTPPPLKPSYDGAKDTRTRAPAASNRKRTTSAPAR